tara:strand:- start:1289 stop:2485 length:1197 start_codon:yes stop_codon:yes gene_type:complete
MRSRLVSLKQGWWVGLGLLFGGALNLVAADGRIELSQDMMPITISQSGNYVLTESLTGTNGAHGITINAGDVDLDLNGYHLLGVAGSRDGVTVPLPRLNLTIRNGTISGWGSNGVAMLSSTNCVVADLRVFENDADGVNSGFASIVTRCLFAYNGDALPTNGIGDGIEVENSSVISDCVAINNDEHGIDAHSGTTIRNCVMLDNRHDGIHGSKGVVINGCVASGNDEGVEVDVASMVQQSVATDSLEDGFRDIAGGCLFKACTAYLNGYNPAEPFGNQIGDGIDIDHGSSVVECVAYSNRQEGIESSAADGVQVLRNVASNQLDEGIKHDGENCRIDENHMIHNAGDGLHIKPGSGGTNNMVTRNVSDGFDVKAGNHIDTVTNPGASTINDPWINIDL